MCDDRPALNPDEIEVTPEMIKAGVREYMLSSEDYQSQEDIVAEIYRVMAEASGRVSA